MQVARLRLRDFRSYAAAERAPRARADGRARAQRRRQDEPARGAVLRLHGPLVPDGQRARARALRRRRCAAWSCDAEDARRPRTSWRRVPAGRGEAHAGRRRAVERLTDASARPLVVRLPARPARARAWARPRCGARISTRSSPRCGPRAPARAARTPRARAAQRAAGRDPRRPGVARVAAGLGRRARAPRHRADAPTARGGGACCAAPSRRTPGAGPEGEADAALPPALARPPTPRGWPAELAERVDGDLERGFTGHGPHRDDLVLARDGPRAARLRLAGPAAHGPARTAAGRARGARGRARRRPAAAARRRHERARRRPPGAPGRRVLRRAAARRDHDDRARRTSRAPTTPDVARLASPRGPCCDERRAGALAAMRRPAPRPSRRARRAGRPRSRPPTVLAAVQPAWPRRGRRRDRRAMPAAPSARGRRRWPATRRSAPGARPAWGPRSWRSDQRGRLGAERVLALRATARRRTRSWSRCTFCAPFAGTFVTL